MTRWAVATALTLVASACTAGDPEAASDTSPDAARDYAVIDAHLHALPASWNGPPPVPMCMGTAVFLSWDGSGTPDPTDLMSCDAPVMSAATDEELMARTLEIMERENVIGIASGPLAFVERWRQAAPDRIVPGVLTSFVDTPLDTLRAYVSSGRVSVLGEVMSQYGGIAPDAPELAPYWSLAEELDVPVGIHVGVGPPAVSFTGTSYRVRAGDAGRLEEVLNRHPRARIYAMHAAYPREDELIALMYAYPQLYAGIGVLGFVIPRPAFHTMLERFVDAGFERRILFGSDQMVWPEALLESIEAVESASFLTDEQKRRILHDNAVEFFRLER